MGEWLRSMMPWGADWIVWAQGLSNQWLDSVFRVLTTLGYEEFYLVLFPLIYWCVNKPAGAALGIFGLLSAWGNTLVKHLFYLPRPADPRIVMRAPRPETSPSFPSGHSQNAVANWGYLAVRLRRWVLWPLALLLIAGIGISRVVLGVHFPQDVIGGWLIGLVLVVVYAVAAPPAGRWLARQKVGLQALLAAGVPIVLVFLCPADAAGVYPAEGAVTPMSAVAGFGLGLIMERAGVGFSVQGPFRQRLLRLLAGLVILAVVYAAPKFLIPEALDARLELSLRFVRYALLGWVGAFFCPWLFVKVGLAGRE